MICPSCGVTVPESRDNCLSCGARIYKTVTSIDSHAAETYVYRNILVSNEDNKFKKNIYIIIGFVLIAAGILLFVSEMLDILGTILLSLPIFVAFIASGIALLVTGIQIRTL
jgi:uncharacterized OB-fold protein